MHTNTPPFVVTKTIKSSGCVFTSKSPSGALMFPLLSTGTSFWTNSPVTGDLRCFNSHVGSVWYRCSRKPAPVICVHVFRLIGFITLTKWLTSSKILTVLAWRRRGDGQITWTNGLTQFADATRPQWVNAYGNMLRKNLRIRVETF